MFEKFHDQKALFKVPKICNINFWIKNYPIPPLALFRKLIWFGSRTLPLHPMQGNKWDDDFLASCVGGNHDYIIISSEEEKEDRDDDNFVKHQFWSGTSAEQIWSLPNRDAELLQKWYFAKGPKVFDETDRRKNRSKTLCGGANPILQMGETVGASQSKLKLEIVLRMANRVLQLAEGTMFV